MSDVLGGKRALVTGSSSGIGEAIALGFAAAGAVVFVHGRDANRTTAVAKAITDKGGAAHCQTGDLKIAADAESLIAAVNAKLGGIDILVNNAGGESSGGGTGAWLAISPGDFMSTYEANVVSAVRMINGFLPGMKERGWGRVIQVASAIAHVPQPTIPDYAAAKAGMITMTQSLAKSLARSGVTANSISPGLILTRSVERWLRAMALQKNWGEDWAVIEKRVSERAIPNLVGRIGRPEDIAHAALFLASPGADFITGEDIPVTGGRP